MALRPQTTRADLANGVVKLDDPVHQKRFLDWVRDDPMIAFRNRETNEIVYSPVCRHGNCQYALQKAIQRDEFLKALLPPVPSQGCEGAAKKRS